MNTEQKALFIDRLKHSDVRSVDFAAAIKTYAAHSPYACREPDEPKKQRGSLDGFWTQAAEALAERFLENTEEFRALVMKHRSCFTLAIFWNHVTAALDGLLNRSSRNEYPNGPIFELMADYSPSCATCLKRYELEFHHVTWANHNLSPLTVTKMLMRSYRNQRYHRTA